MEVKNKNYVTGIIGALIGGIIASIPWIICYVYLEWIWSLLAAPIALGALKGYQLLKGKEDKKLPIIISIVSIVVITLVTLVIIPLLLLAQEGLSVNFTTLKLLYQFSDFKSAILTDYFLALVFTGLGISGIIANVKKQVNNENVNNQTNNSQPQFVNNQMNNSQPQFVNNQMNNSQPQFVNNQMNNSQPQFVNNQMNNNQPQFVNNQMNNNPQQFMNNQMSNNSQQFINNQMSNNSQQFINNQTNENNHLM